HDSHAELCSLLLVELKEVIVVLLTDLVAGEDDDILRIISFNKVNVLIDRVGRTLIPVRSGHLLIRGKDMHTAVETVQIPRLSVSDVLIQYQWLILCQNTNRINSWIHAVRQRKVNN